MNAVVCAHRSEEEFPDTEWNEKRDEIIEIRNAAGTAGQLPDAQGEPTPRSCLFLFIAKSRGKGGVVLPIIQGSETLLIPDKSLLE